MKKYVWKDLGLDLFYDIIGSIMIAVSINCFAKPAHFATGGIGGLALITNYLTNAPIGMVQIIYNIPLILLSYRILGKYFILRTAKTMVVMSLILDIMAPVMPAYTGNALLAALFAGLLDGLGIAVIFLRGGSTGGIDFLTMSIRKKKPHISLGSIALCINAVILAAGALAFKNIDAALYGAVASFASSMIIDKIMYGAGAEKMLLIITEKGSRVAQAIDKSTGRGSSIAQIQGSYTGQNKQLVISAMSKNQIFLAKKAVRDTDASSFVMVSSADRVFGEGFNETEE